MTITDGYQQPLPSQEPDDLEHLNAAPSFDDGSAGDDDEFDDEPTRDTGKPRNRGRAPRTPIKVSTRTVRTVLAKHAELASARPEDISLLAATLGTKENLDELVAHILSAPRLTLTGTVELDAIVKAAAVDPFDAVAVAMSHEPQSKAVWGILVALGLLDGPRPSKDGDTSVAIARAAGKFSAEHEARLDTVKGLARKGN